MCPCLAVRLAEHWLFWSLCSALSLLRLLGSLWGCFLLSQCLEILLESSQRADVIAMGRALSSNIPVRNICLVLNVPSISFCQSSWPSCFLVLPGQVAISSRICLLWAPTHLPVALTPTYEQSYWWGECSRSR
jgi:hypothetical protein